MCGSCQDFAHLHVHTRYSFLDGVSDITRLMRRVSDIGQKSVAITDHGGMFGVVDFFRAARDSGIKPIIGIESYLARKDMSVMDVSERKPFHLLMLAQDNVGYSNLMQLSSKAWLDGFYYRPRVDKELLLKHAEGVVVTSGCLAAEIPSMILTGRADSEVQDTINWWAEAFQDRFFLELQYRLNSPDQHRVNKELINWGRKLGIPLIATTDAHYVEKGDAEIHDTMLCVQTKSLKSDAKRMRFDEDTYYIVDTEEMYRYFSEVPDAVTNTRDIADSCNVDIETKGYHLPVYPVPKGYDTKSFLSMLCYEGLKWRYQDDVTEGLRRRIEYELSVINTMQFDRYFLVVWDLCEFARHKDIWWNVRGSGAGSLVAYVLGITAIDPIENGLYFERFLNPSRISMPDIDLDFPDNRRDELVKYLVLKYGDDKVAAIATFGTMGAKGAVRDIGRALEVDRQTINQLSGKIKQGLSVAEALETEDVKKMIAESLDVAKVMDIALKVEGTPRHTSTHAAGFVVADRPLADYIPLTKMREGSTFGDTGLKQVTQFPMETVEQLGLLKIDILGLATLTIMRECCRLIEERHGDVWTIDSIPYRHTGLKENDADLDAAFAMIGRGETTGVFQIEGDGLTQMLRHMKPYKFEHIVAAISLFRPGPMGMNSHNVYIQRMHGEEEVTYKHPALEPILKETEGLLVYQEQIMRIASELFGYDPGEADKIRKAVSKKKHDELKKNEAIFLERGPLNGIDRDTAKAIWDEIIYFADYGFNKAHASDYAKICLQTAFLKSKYPVEYMVALMRVYSGNEVKLAKCVASCRNMGIEVVPPDIRYSGKTFTIEKDALGRERIRFGLTQVKSVGWKPSATLLKPRDESGFATLEDFLRAVNIRAVNRNVLENLIKVGVFDHYADRKILIFALDAMRDYSAQFFAPSKAPTKKAKKQLPIFEEDDKVKSFDLQGLEGIQSVKPASTRERLDWEKDLLGIYVSSRPTDRYREAFERAMTSTISVILGDGEKSDYAGHRMKIGGQITRVKFHVDKKGRKMAFFDLEDWNEDAGVISVTVFYKLFEENTEAIKEGNIILLQGLLGDDYGGVKMIAEKITLLGR